MNAFSGSSVGHYFAYYFSRPDLKLLSLHVIETRDEQQTIEAPGSQITFYLLITWANRFKRFNARYATGLQESTSDASPARWL